MSQPTHYTAATAADLLSRDPAITVTRAQLFEWITAHGWAIRTDTGYRPTHVAHSLCDVIPAAAGRKTWDQLVITRVGLHLIHAALGGTHALATTTAMEPTP